jgi:hypothetical protein
MVRRVPEGNSGGIVTRDMGCGLISSVRVTTAIESVQLKIDKNNAWYASKMAGILRAHHSFKEA